MTPAKRDSTTNSAAMEEHLRKHPRCRECRWEAITDLSVHWVLGYMMTLCTNPWACWGRQIDLDEHLSSGGV